MLSDFVLNTNFKQICIFKLINFHILLTVLTQYPEGIKYGWLQRDRQGLLKIIKVSAYVG